MARETKSMKTWPSEAMTRINAQLVAVSNDHGVPIAMMVSGRHKTEPVIAARTAFLVWLRGHVRYRDSPKGRDVVVTADAEGYSRAYPDFRPISTPMMASLVGMDHSAVIHALRRAGKNRSVPSSLGAPVASQP